ncbi:glutathione hydrolase 1 proenzyme-like [Haliotis rufescens]|uniref:glutathione hydrolase 1 proenzyme-like n=1 Tax=Haliotis rufescens TaxID=6454 RepID=UPI00201F7FA1|nr:glutathione hydrolase 1 proenzyme-like [Haliotis rufescens]
MADSDLEGKDITRRSRPIVIALIAGALIIGLGLAFGLGFGLRSFHHDAPQLVETSTKSSVQQPPKSKRGYYRFASVTSDAKICSDIGTKILAVHRGSAVDAAIATMVCIGVVQRQSCGIGGGFFMTFYNRSTRAVEVLDARERAPLVANESFYIGKVKGASVLGGLAIGVPGDVMGHWEAHQRFGRVPWRELFQPTIDLCRNGVPILEPIHRAITLYAEVLKNMSYTMYFDNVTGEAVKVGDRVKYHALADTLERIAEKGAPVYYNGSLTDDIVADISEHGGVITREDLNLYTATWRTPVNVTLRDNLTVHSMPPPGSGAVFEYMLNILDGYGFTPDSLSTNEKSVLTYHRIVEAMKFAYAKRTDLGDEDFVDVAELVRNMTSLDFGDYIRGSITDSVTHDTDYYGATFYDQTKTGTSNACIIDAEGNAVTITATINTFFGSKIRGRRTGITFNNEMDDFSTPGIINQFGVPASEANFIKPRKRPQSSMCPSIIVNQTSGDVVMTIGASGGTRITTSVALVAMFALRMGVPIADAVDHKRLHHQLLPKQIRIERGFSQDIIDGLKAKGHEIDMNTAASVVSAIHVTGGLLHAVADVRKGGEPAGY